MPDDYRSNSMQVNLGLLPGSSAPYGAVTPSPGETSMRLMMQSQEQLGQVKMQAQAPMPTASANVFQYQFQKQLQTIQQQQSMSPYIAQAYAQAMPWSQQYQGGIMPSPLTMTPPSTGIFRPPPPPVMSPISPMYSPPMMGTPFTPRPTSPMFQTSYEQFYQGTESQQNRMFSMGAQVPGFAGQALAYGGGAFAGAKIGGAIGGRWGAVAGALGGAMFAGRSGFAEGVGDVFKMPFQPMVEQRQMGAALQRMSQDWVVTGDQLAPGGRGLSRGAGVDLARGFQNMAGDRGFRQETGGMFNREDLMKMTGLSGQAGLLDMSQNVPQIQGKMREIAKNVRDFMQLTNDPDVTNVIREMGRMQSFGLTGGQITQAAQNMRYFSRAAGTSIQGLQQMGGLPGAMTYQGVGLSAGQGFEYGNYSAAMARQSVASGTYSQQQLSLMGGVQGLTQRNTQAQAAFMSMPLLGAAMSSYGQGGWGVGAGGLQGGGAFGMVNQAMSAMNQGVRQGGLGALAMFPLQQRDIQSQVAANMTPEEQTAMRFKLAMQTGRRLGLKGEGGFAAGARIAYGDEVAEQMMYEAKNPQFWGAQRDMISQRRTELAFSQRKQAQEIAAGPMSGVKEGFASVGGGFSAFGRGIQEGVGGVGQGIGEWWEDRQARANGQIVSRRDRSSIAGSADERRALTAGGYGGVNIGDSRGMMGNSWYAYSNSMRDTDLYGRARDQVMGGRVVAAGVGTASRSLLSVAGPGGAAFGVVDSVLKEGLGIDFIHSAQDITMTAGMDAQDKRDMLVGATKQWKQNKENLRYVQATGKERVAVFEKGVEAIAGKDPKKNMRAREAIHAAARGFAGELEARSGMTAWLLNEDKIDDAMVRRRTVQAFWLAKGTGTYAEAEKEFNKLDPATRTSWTQTVLNDAAATAGPGQKEKILKYQETQNLGLSGAAESRLADMRRGTELGVKALESKLDFTYDIGGVGIFGGKSEKAGAETFRSELISATKGGKFKYSALDVAAMSVASGKNNTAERKAELRALWLKENKGGTAKEFDAWFMKNQDLVNSDTLSAGTKERLSEALGKGVKLSDVTGLVEGTRRGKGTEQFLSGTEALKGYGFDINDALNKGGKFDTVSIAQSIDETTLKNMEAKGGKVAEEAKLIRKVRGGDKKAKEEWERINTGRGSPKEKSVTSATEAGGAEASKLDRSDAALSDMQAVFADFSPAVDDFKSGAKMFREAMETEWLNRQKD